MSESKPAGRALGVPRLIHATGYKVDDAALEPLSPRIQPADFAPDLACLQANVLKGHGRSYSANLMLRIVSPSAFQDWLGRTAFTSSARQWEESKAFKEKGRQGDLMRCIAFSNAALKKFMVPELEDSAFRLGMTGARTVRILADPPPAQWEFADPDVWLMLAHHAPARLRGYVQAELEALGAAVEILAVEHGIARFNKAREGIEHFGYVDGRSQPLFTDEQVDDELQSMPDPHRGFVWDPSTDWTQLLVEDPLVPGTNCYGSYLVFRKLEQNVAGFKTRAAELAAALGLEGDDAERAGALVVGRFEDGTPVVSDTEATGDKPVCNNFDYRNNANGLRCPFHAHIRKVNPRTPDTHEHLMARRGILYGERPDLDEHSEPLPGSSFPSAGVGLLFAAYMSSIVNQFEFTQKTWANSDTNSETEGVGSGADPVIGQKIAAAQKWPMDHNPNQKRCLRFADFVTMKGGGYFFAPSIAGIRALAQADVAPASPVA